MRRDEAPNAIAQIDGLRGAAALTVAVYHWTAFARVEHPAFVAWSSTLFMLSELAVSTFFVVSGFLLTLSVIRVSASTSGGDLLRRYFIARVVRITPLLIVVVTAAVLVIAALRWTLGITSPWGSYSELTVRQWALNITLLNTNLSPPAWTLVYEVAAYILLPFVVLACVRPGKERLLWLAAAPVVGWLIAAYWLAPRSGIVGMMAMFIPGVALAFLLERLGRGSAWMYLALSVVTLAAVPLSGVRYYDLPLVTASGCALLIAAAITASGLAQRALTARPMMMLGEMTYSIYMWHYLIFWCLYYLTGSYVGTLSWKYYALVGAIGFPALFAVSWLSFKFIERPMIRRGRRMAGAVPALV